MCVCVFINLPIYDYLYISIRIMKKRSLIDRLEKTCSGKRMGGNDVIQSSCVKFSKKFNEITNI